MNNRHLIVASDLNKRLGEPGLAVIDCRFDLMNPAAGRTQWLAAHIPGAAYADLDKDLAAPVTANSGRHPLPDVAAMCGTFGRLGVGSDDKVVVYDSGSGAIAARAWWLLRWLGHDNVALLDGGYAAWMAAGFTTEEGETAVPARVFEGAARDELVLQTTEVVNAHPVPRDRLFDARDAARYRGEVEPIDRVAGHIPGTRNFPFADSLQADGRWKTVGDLRSVWSEHAGAATGADWGVMCGSGVTACHLALSACVAGIEMPRLYVGSWSEWITDSKRPVAGGDSGGNGSLNAAEPA